MKQINLVCLFVVIFQSNAIAQENINTPENFLDPAFRRVIEQFMGVEEGGVITAQDAAQKKGTLDCSNNFRIRSLKGIEYFAQLEGLNCSNLFSLKELDISQNVELKTLNCDDTELIAIDLSKNSNLENLSCTSIRLQELNVSQNPVLETLHCDFNRLLTLDISKNPQLKILHCFANALQELDISQNHELEILNCRSNQISNINFGQITNLIELNCSSNKITNLSVNQFTKLEKLYFSYNRILFINTVNNLNLKELECHSTGISELDVSNLTHLKVLYCSRNDLTSIDTQNNPLLTELDCSKNDLQILDISANPMLTYLDCSSNYLKVLPISSNPNLEVILCADNLLLSIDTSAHKSLTELDCSLNSITNLDLLMNSNLARLDCSQTRLKSLNSSNLVDLIEIQCHHLRISELDVSSNTLLQILNCSNNLISFINLSNLKVLREIYLNNNQLTTMPQILTNDNLSIVDIRYNNLTIDSCPAIQELLNHIGYAQFRDFFTGELTIENGFAFNPQNGNNENLCEDQVSNENINTPENFPDPKFRDYVEKYMNVNNDGEFTAAQAALKTEQLYTSQSNSLKGIEFFTGLEDLYYDGHQKMRTVDVSRNSALRRLIVRHSLIGKIDIMNNTLLDYLSLSDNKLQSLDVSKNLLLTSLFCSENQLVELNLENQNILTTLSVNTNNLTSLNLANNKALINLKCDDNDISDISSILNLEALKKVEIQNNRLDCNDFASVLELLAQAGEPVYNERIPGRKVFQSGLIFSPQKNLDPFDCNNHFQFTQTPTTAMPTPFPTPTPSSLNTHSPYTLQILEDVPEFVLQNSEHRIVFSYNNPDIFNWNITYSGNVTVVGNGRQNHVIFFTLPTQLAGESFVIVTINDGIYTNSLRFNYTVVSELPSPTPTPMNWILPTPTNTPTLPASPIQINTREYFPDDSFREAVEYFMRIGVYPVGFTAEQAAAKTGFLDCSGRQIFNLKGIEYLPNLTGLNCGDNFLTTIDISKNTRLKELICYSNRLTKLNVSNNIELEYLSCFNNQLFDLDLSNNTVLKSLFCFSNHLSMISYSSTDSFETILCDDNKLRSISNLMHFPFLKKLDIRNNDLDCDDISEIQVLSEQLGGWNPQNGNGIKVLPQNSFTIFDCPTSVKSWILHQ